MNAIEFRNHPEYAKCMEKIRSYRKGFEFTIPFYKMTQGQKNGMTIVLRDAMKQGLIDSVSMTLSLECEITEETYKRI